jgi:hypothetical protein
LSLGFVSYSLRLALLRLCFVLMLVACFGSLFCCLSFFVVVGREAQEAGDVCTRGTLINVVWGTGK